MVMKVIKKSKKESDLHTSFKELENCDSPYLVRYKECYEDEKEYRVRDRVGHNGIDTDGEL